jgi:hypothetical protein
MTETPVWPEAISECVCCGHLAEESKFDKTHNKLKCWFIKISFFAIPFVFVIALVVMLAIKLLS